MEVVLNLISSLRSHPLPRTEFFCQEICLEVERNSSNLEDGFQKKKYGKFVAITNQTSLADLGEHARDLRRAETVQGCGMEKHRGRSIS